MTTIERFPTTPQHRRRQHSPADEVIEPPRRSTIGVRIAAAVAWAVVVVLAAAVHEAGGGAALSRLVDEVRAAFVIAPDAFVDPATSGTRSATASRGDDLAASFTLCGSGRRWNCVVDGDTFWHQGVKIRIADIDTPELSPPRCEAERVKGEAARRRLLALLNSGAFSLAEGGHDEDRYGRKLRKVERAGSSLGDVLVEEGLARRWDGARRSWCG